jgi:hypothetical protein
MTNPRDHWNRIYETKDATEMSWTQPSPALSLDLIAETGIAKNAGVIDIGGGASPLVDALLDAGYDNLAVLDISGAALERSRERLGTRADQVEWIESDITRFAASRRYAIWHDRAVFHFLTAAEDRRKYVAAMLETLQENGHAIIATFSIDGPQKCSGLEIVQYDEQTIVAEIGPEMALRDVRREIHRTPWGSEQRFVYFRFERRR